MWAPITSVCDCEYKGERERADQCPFHMWYFVVFLVLSYVCACVFAVLKCCVCVCACVFAVLTCSIVLFVRLCVCCVNVLCCIVVGG